MKCERCPFAPPLDSEGHADCCPILDTEYGTEWRDGRLGCTMHYQTLLKNTRDYDTALGTAGLEMGLEMDLQNHSIPFKKAVEHAKHVVGLDVSKPYTRHGRKYYKPYRNYWEGFDAALDLMSHEAFGLVEKLEQEGENQTVVYSLTREGLDWLGRRLGVTIHDPRSATQG